MNIFMRLHDWIAMRSQMYREINADNDRHWDLYITEQAGRREVEGRLAKALNDIHVKNEQILSLQAETAKQSFQLIQEQASSHRLLGELNKRTRELGEANESGRKTETRIEEAIGTLKGVVSVKRTDDPSRDPRWLGNCGKHYSTSTATKTPPDEIF